MGNQTTLVVRADKRKEYVFLIWAFICGDDLYFLNILPSDLFLHAAIHPHHATFIDLHRFALSCSKSRLKCDEHSDNRKCQGPHPSTYSNQEHREQQCCAYPKPWW